MKALHLAVLISLFHPACKSRPDEGADAKEIESVTRLTWHHSPGGAATIKCGQSYYDVQTARRMCPDAPVRCATQFVIDYDRISDLSMNEMNDRFCTGTLDGGGGSGSGGGGGGQMVVTAGTYSKSLGDMPCQVIRVEPRLQGGVLRRVSVFCGDDHLVFNCGRDGCTGQGGRFEVFDDGTIEITGDSGVNTFGNLECGANSTIFRNHCWYLGERGQNCSTTCSNKGKTFAPITCQISGEECKSIAIQIGETHYDENLGFAYRGTGCRLNYSSSLSSAPHLYFGSSCNSDDFASDYRRFCACTP